MLMKTEYVEFIKDKAGRKPSKLLKAVSNALAVKRDRERAEREWAAAREAEAARGIFARMLG